MSKPLSIFVTHGAPTLLIDDSPSRTFLQGLQKNIPWPKAVIVVSAHNIADRVKVGTSASFRQVADFGGFPEELFLARYAPPGAPELAQEVLKALSEAGIEAEASSGSGIDHGIWIPLALAYPQADLPIIPVSIQRGLDPAYHMRMGVALRRLCEKEDLLILCSGSITHNLRDFGLYQLDAPPREYAEQFADWVERQLRDGRTADLINWQKLAPQAARNHPSIEHFVPLFVALGAGESHPATTLHRSYSYGIIAMDAYAFD